MPTHDEIAELKVKVSEAEKIKRLELSELQHMLSQLHVIDFIEERKEEEYEIDVPEADGVEAHKETRTRTVSIFEKIPTDRQMPEVELTPERQDKIFQHCKTTFEKIIT